MSNVLDFDFACIRSGPASYGQGDGDACLNGIPGRGAVRHFPEKLVHPSEDRSVGGAWTKTVCAISMCRLPPYPWRGGIFGPDFSLVGDQGRDWGLAPPPFQRS